MDKNKFNAKFFFFMGIATSLLAVFFIVMIVIAVSVRLFPSPEILCLTQLAWIIPCGISLILFYKGLRKFFPKKRGTPWAISVMIIGGVFLQAAIVASAVSYIKKVLMQNYTGGLQSAVIAGTFVFLAVCFIAWGYRNLLFITNDKPLEA